MLLHCVPREAPPGARSADCDPTRARGNTVSGCDAAAAPPVRARSRSKPWEVVVMLKRSAARVVRLLAPVLLGLAPALESGATRAAEQPDDGPPPETRWPHEITSGPLTLRVHQPQLQSWDGSLLKVRAAVAASEGKDAPPTYGIIEAQARTLVDKQQRLVTLDQLDVVRADFPSAPQQAAAWTQLIEADNAQRRRTIALDRLEAALEINAAESAVGGPPLRNDPPQLVFATKPSMLILIDGEPAWRALPDSAYERIINTRALLVRRKGGPTYLRVFDGWMLAPSLTGKWSVVASPPPDLDPVLKAAIESRQVDLLTGQTDPEQPGPSLKSAAPEIYIATRPTELVVVDGEPKWIPIPGTQLLFVENTTGHVFKLVSDQKTYVLASGRWFRAPSTKGPWEHVPADELAKDFAAIPDDSPKENVKASVAGVPQAKEAAIAAQIPETAAVRISQAKLTTPVFDGDPKFEPISGTSLQYVVNSPTPIIKVDAKDYYAVENAVWFKATSVRGPWAVATSVPAVIYTIPPSSPLHYVTYVKIYDVVGDTVYVGYTPGYHGEMVDPVTHVVVYGTGYYYEPWVGTVWYGPPVTYGFGVALRYTPWTGWTVGFGFGWTWGNATVAIGWGWGAYPWWGAYGWGWGWGPPMYPIYPAPYWGGVAAGPRGAMAWGPGGWVASTGNVYRRWGDTASVSRASAGYNAWTGTGWAGQAGMSYNSRTGTLAAGQRGAAANVYTGRYASGARGAATNASTGVSAATRQATVGNARTGQEISAGQSVMYDRNTGEAVRTGHISGDQGTVARVGDDVYAGHDGNVYRRSDSGWEQVERGGGSTYSAEQTRQQLERDMSARSHGAERYAGRQASTRAMSRGGGRRR
jgi:hypothetical protein